MKKLLSLMFFLLLGIVGITTEAKADGFESTETFIALDDVGEWPAAGITRKISFKRAKFYRTKSGVFKNRFADRYKKASIKRRDNHRGNKRGLFKRDPYRKCSYKSTFKRNGLKAPVLRSKDN